MMGGHPPPSKKISTPQNIFLRFLLKSKIRNWGGMRPLGALKDGGVVSQNPFFNVKNIGGGGEVLFHNCYMAYLQFYLHILLCIYITKLNCIYIYYLYLESHRLLLQIEFLLR